mmetsp:Transcript_17813/g.48445  ORF Transcript_17813/g.48445 Transcript_17813/m.48445 type:complete len:391 (-) Transcript_17813:430-1602(-)
MVQLKGLFGKNKKKKDEDDHEDHEDPEEFTLSNKTSEIDGDGEGDHSTTDTPSSKENEPEEPFQFPKRKKANANATQAGEHKAKRSIFDDSLHDFSHRHESDEQEPVFTTNQEDQKQEEAEDVSEPIVGNGDDVTTAQSVNAPSSLCESADKKKKNKKHNKKKKKPGSGDSSRGGEKSKNRRSMKSRSKSRRSVLSDEATRENQLVVAVEPTERQAPSGHHEDEDDDTAYTSLGFGSINVDNPQQVPSSLNLASLGTIQWKEVLMTVPHTLHNMIFPQSSSSPNYAVISTLQPYLHHIDEATDELKKQVRSVVRLSHGEDDDESENNEGIPLEAERALEMINLTNLPPHEQQKFIKLLLEQERVRLMRTLDQLQQIQIDLKSTLEDMTTK